MPKALWLLTWLRIKSMFRRLGLACQTTKGVLTLMLMTGLLALMVIPGISAALSGEIEPGFASQFQNYVVLGILAVFLVGLIKPGHGAILFLPEEVEALFAAPFTRRQILAFKLIGSALRMPWMALFFTVIYGIYFANVVSAFIGILLTLAFIQYGGVLLAVSGQVTYATFMNRSKRMIGIILLIVIGLLAAQGFSSFSQSLTYESFQHWVDGICNSQIGSIVLAPVKSFTNLIFAAHIDFKFVTSLLIALGEITIILALVLFLDANFIEVNMQEAKSWMERVNRNRAGVSSLANKEYHRTLPMLPFWRGLGPIVWRQILSVMRLGQSTFALSILLLGGLAVIVVAKQNGVDSQTLRSTTCIGLGMMTLLFGLVGPVGFRPDIERIGVLKGLPLGDLAIVIGQILGGVIVLSTIQFTVLLGVWLLDMNLFWLLAMVVMIPLNYLVLVVSNSMLLLFPVRTNPASQDAIAGGQNLLSFFAVYLSLIAVALIIGIPTGLTHWGLAIPAVTFLTAISIGLVCCTGATLILKWAYRRFDVSVDTPS